MCESHLFMRVALCASRILLCESHFMRVACDHCKSHFNSASRTLISASRTRLLQVPHDFCELLLTSASCTWLLRVAHDFCESHFMRVTFYCASCTLCESHSNCASRTLRESHFILRVELYASRILKCFPSPPSPPLRDKSLGCATNIHRRLDLMRLLFIAWFCDVNVYIDCKYLYAGSCIDAPFLAKFSSIVFKPSLIPSSPPVSYWVLLSLPTIFRARVCQNFTICAPRSPPKHTDPTRNYPPPSLNRENKATQKNIMWVWAHSSKRYKHPLCPLVLLWTEWVN